MINQNSAQPPGFCQRSRATNTQSIYKLSIYERIEATKDMLGYDWEDSNACQATDALGLKNRD
jgi:hypothetical protein